jgi:hypothetical protein
MKGKSKQFTLLLDLATSQLQNSSACLTLAAQVHQASIPTTQ